MSLYTKDLLHHCDDGVHVIAFHRDPQGQANTDLARGFFALDFLTFASGMDALVIDLEGVQTLDSGALGPLVQKLRDVQERNGQMALTGVTSPALREIFALTRFDRVFSLHATLAEAVKAVRERQ